MGPSDSKMRSHRCRSAGEQGGCPADLPRVGLMAQSVGARGVEVFVCAEPVSGLLTLLGTV
eukprot:261356-Pyramimonas_sp.AAC.1